jgi:hypothetical protein
MHRGPTARGFWQQGCQAVPMLNGKRCAAKRKAGRLR